LNTPNDGFGTQAHGIDDFAKTTEKSDPLGWEFWMANSSSKEAPAHRKYLLSRFLK
jgi:hypothetical protein